jgi:hypothetical protein
MSDLKVPDGLGEAGQRVWHDLTGVLDFDEREALLLEAACRQADTIAELEAAIERDGVTVKGAAGQSRLNMCLTELRQGRIAFARLLGELEIPTDGEVPVAMAASRRARKAVSARWASQRAANLELARG